MQGKFLIPILMINIANYILLPTGNLVLALEKKLPYGKLDREQISTISTQVVILLDKFNLENPVLIPASQMYFYTLQGM